MRAIASFRLITAALVLSCWASSAHAQASLQVPLEFDFLNPGARSLALGSAFVGLADDASAAFTNPAGLTVLGRPEVSFEGRARHVESPFLERGRLSGTVTNQGIDTVSGPQYGTATDNTFSPGFFSFVYPHQNRFAIAAYRHELTAIDTTFRTQGVFQFEPAIHADIRETALDASRSMTVTSYGGAFAFRPIETLSIGGGVSASRLKIDSTFTRFVTFPMYSAATYDPALAVFRGTQTADGWGVGGSIGFLWMPMRLFQLGAVARLGPSVDFQQSLSDLPGTPTVTSGPLKVPNVVAAGFALRPRDNATVTFEYTFVQYSQLKNDYVDLQASPSGRQANFTIDDGSEVHAGFEYVLTNLPGTPALRVGYWRDPAHAVVYHAPASADPTDQRFAAYLPGEDALNHVTFGGGVPFSPQFELNAGADLSSRRSFFSLFAVVRF